MATLRGLNADCKPITMETHRVALKTFRLGTYTIR
jgi:hypothetical protein